MTVDDLVARPQWFLAEEVIEGEAAEVEVGRPELSEGADIGAAGTVFLALGVEQIGDVDLSDDIAVLGYLKTTCSHRIGLGGA